MNYEEFIKFVQSKCMHETIYEDSEGRLILVIDMLDAYGMANKFATEEREACAKLCDEIATEDGWEGSYAYRCVEAIRARGQ
jgi:hypothetical protein